MRLEARIPSGDHRAVPLAPSDVRPFYDASLLGLRLLDARLPAPRRFGPDADARWANFRGHLTARDRIELLLRDGDAEHAGAFSARQVFEIYAVAEDEPFGGEWSGLDDSAAEQALARAAAGAPPRRGRRAPPRRRARLGVSIPPPSTWAS